MRIVRSHKLSPHLPPHFYLKLSALNRKLVSFGVTNWLWQSVLGFFEGVGAVAARSAARRTRSCDTYVIFEAGNFV